ncbi:HIF1N-like protein [Mya arenaria]|uniref:HIF1N-like protein n=1 Tax=Mya arenaria TaxID=6604 RepID=A0ABY7DIZ1_MYAAR|nr:HIF1N-like protein [Mya arenaria]
MARSLVPGSGEFENWKPAPKMAASYENESENRFNGNSFSIPFQEIPRFPKSDKRVNELISCKEPVIVTGSDLVGSASHWSLDYLAENIGDGTFNVYKSASRKFKYYSDKKMQAVHEFAPPTQLLEMRFQEFMKLIRSKTNTNSESEQQQGNSWGQLTSNLLLVGMPGNVTPVHYDEQENLFAQIRGSKRFLLFHPDQFENLYPYPVHHPHDRQSQVDLENPDYEQFPNVRNLHGYEGVVGPGDVLYIPMYWWHQVESCPDSEENISVNFWYMAGSVEKIEHPLSAQQKVAMSRNIEKMCLEALGDPSEVAPFMKMLVLGRYT